MSRNAKRDTSAADSAALKLYTVEQVAILCQVSVKTVYRAIWHGRLRASQLGVGAAYRVRFEDLQDWIETSVRRVPSPKRVAQPLRANVGARRSNRPTSTEGRLFLPEEVDGGE